MERKAELMSNAAADLISKVWDLLRYLSHWPEREREREREREWAREGEREQERARECEREQERESKREREQERERARERESEKEREWESKRERERAREQERGERNLIELQRMKSWTERVEISLPSWKVGHRPKLDFGQNFADLAKKNVSKGCFSASKKLPQPMSEAQFFSKLFTKKMLFGFFPSKKCKSKLRLKKVHLLF